jgi:dynein heavy chain, axonemal
MHAEGIYGPFLGDCTIAASFISYLGPFNKEFRQLILARDFFGACTRLGIPLTEDMDVCTFLIEHGEIGEWNLQV